MRVLFFFPSIEHLAMLRLSKRKFPVLGVASRDCCQQSSVESKGRFGVLGGSSLAVASSSPLQLGGGSSSAFITSLRAPETLKQLHILHGAKLLAIPICLPFRSSNYFFMR